MDRVLMVSGSLQARSANRMVLNVIAGRVGGAPVGWFERLREVPAFDPDRAEDEQTAVTAWRAAVGGAAVVVLGVPEYAGGMAGSTKNALDWLVGTGELYRKPVAVFSTGTTGGEHARRQAVQTVTWQGAYVVVDLGIALPKTKFATDGRVTHEPTAAMLAEAAARVAAAPTMGADELVARATEIASALGIDLAHVTPT